MFVSTKGRYALRVMIDLAEHNTDLFIPLKETATRQNVPLKYLESIMTVLSKAGLVDGTRGKGGGYRLNRTPGEYTVGSILTLTETTLAPVTCLESVHNTCPLAAGCKTLPMWMELDKLIHDFFARYTLADLIAEESLGNYEL